MTLLQRKNSETIEFSSEFHKMAYLIYNHVADNELRITIVKFLKYLTDDNVGVLKALYVEANQFARYITIKRQWDDKIIKENIDDKLKGDEGDILLYILEQLCLEDCRKKRKKQLDRRSR